MGLALFSDGGGVGGLGGGGVARAQSRGSHGFDQPAFNLQIFRPAVDSYGYATVNGSTTLMHLDFSVALIGSWAYQPLSLELAAGQQAFGAAVQGARNFAVQHLVTPQFQFMVGLGRRFELGLSLPVSIMLGRRQRCDAMGQNCRGYDLPSGEDDLRFAQGQVTDPGVHLKLNLLDNARYPVGLALMAAVYLPIPRWADVPTAEYLLGEENVTLRPQIVLDRDWLASRRLRTAINFGALVRFASRSFQDRGDPRVTGRDFCAPSDVTVGASPSPCGTGLTRAAGTQLTYGLGAQFAVVPRVFDVLGEIYGYADVAGNASDHPMEGLAALKLHISARSYFLAGVSGGLIPGQTGSPTVRVFGGFLFEPGDRDRDRDGLRDDVDKCPDQPEDKDGFEDEDGCPELDNDMDGVPDAQDKCPFDAENRNSFQDEDGCPDQAPAGTAPPPSGDGDRDRDGVPDAQDRCPDDPEDKDGYQDSDGCPDPDNDHDGVLDAFDKCPEQPESVNGFEDEDGCPDTPKKALVEVTDTKVEILEKVYFETNKAVIKPVSYPVLDAVASVLRHSPKIKMVEIQGHADQRGSEQKNLKLTQERATAIQRYLEMKGVESARLSARGYGSSKPICEDFNEACWSRNRRVEFVIGKRE